MERVLAALKSTSLSTAQVVMKFKSWFKMTAAVFGFSTIIYVRRKVRIGTIPELSCAKWEFSLCPPIPELYRTILELRKGYRLYIGWVYVPAQSGNSWMKN